MQKITFWLDKKSQSVEISDGQNVNTFSLQELKESSCNRIIKCIDGIGMAQCGGCLPIYNDTCVAKFKNSSQK